jgi:transposase InsO family protein
MRGEPDITEFGSRPSCGGRSASVIPEIGDTTGVIFHDDRGCQHTSAQLDQAAGDHGLRLSVGRTGVSWDNA